MQTRTAVLLTIVVMLFITVGAIMYTGKTDMNQHPSTKCKKECNDDDACSETSSILGDDESLESLVHRFAQVQQSEIDKSTACQ